jgi:hypothetical protein
MRRLIMSLMALALVVTACSSTPDEAGPATTAAPSATNPTILRPNRPITGVPAAQSLVQFDECAGFLDYVVEHALELVGPYGLQGGFFGYRVAFNGFLEGDVAFASEDRAVGAPAPQAATAPSSGVDFSGTNIQELGVDEPDIVKTDGRRIIALSEQTLFIIDITGADPVLVGSVTVRDVAIRDLFLSGDRVFALGSSFGGGYNWNSTATTSAPGSSVTPPGSCSTRSRPVSSGPSLRAVGSKLNARPRTRTGRSLRTPRSKTGFRTSC